MAAGTTDFTPGTLSVIPYRQAVERQRQLVLARQRGEIPDLVWYLEHPPVVTWNPGRTDRHLSAMPEDFRAAGVAVEETDRGGDVTYHGPGQLVGYPIIDLSRGDVPGRDLHLYLRGLEEGLIEALGVWGLAGARVEGLTGVWVGDEKIAAIGVRASRWVVSHGFALNVACDLAPFRELIVPCGISDRGVTSMECLLEAAPRCEDLLTPVHLGFERALCRRLAMTFNSFAIVEPKL